VHSSLNSTKIELSAEIELMRGGKARNLTGRESGCETKTQGEYVLPSMVFYYFYFICNSFCLAEATMSLGDNPSRVV
jgi:hypothetical protein